MEERNLPGTEFKTLVIRMFNEPRGRIDQLSGNFNNEMANTKKGRDTIKN